MRKSLMCLMLFVAAIHMLPAQEITVFTDDYKHQFEGAGVSIGLFLGHHYSMPQSGQEEAIRLINKDLNMQYLQDYIGIYPSDDPAYFDRRANYIKAAKVYNENIQVSMVGNIFPDDLRTDAVVNGKTYRVLDTDDPEIYDRLALWYYSLLEGFKERGVDVDILNVVNEPDLNACNNQFRTYHYGLNGDTKKGVAMIFKEAVPKLRALIDDASANELGVKMPLIMGPSTISPKGCLDYIEYFKNNYPSVWEMIDIVATHQYIDGHRADLMGEIQSQLEGKAFHQSETHASRNPNQADDLGSLPIEEDHRTGLSLSRIFSVAVNNGVSAWYYFENNYPDAFHPGGLIQVAWGAQAPVPYKHYYVFQQLTTTQPANAFVLNHETDGFNKTDVLVFREQDEDTLYLHLGNYFSVNVSHKITLNSLLGDQTMTSIAASVTDADRNNEAYLDTLFTSPQEEYSFKAPPYSVSTLKISLGSTVTSTSNNRNDISISPLQNSIKISSERALISDVTIFSLTGQKIYEDLSVLSEHIELQNIARMNQILLVKVVTEDKIYVRKIKF